MQAAPLSFALVVENACVEGANVMRMNQPATEYPASFVNVTTTLVTDLWAESSVEAMDNADVGNASHSGMEHWVESRRRMATLHSQDIVIQASF